MTLDSKARRTRRRRTRPSKRLAPVDRSRLSAVTTPSHRVLFLTTATKPPLGADVAVLTQVIRSLDPGRHEVHVWMSVGDASNPTPAYETIRDVAGLHLHPVNISRPANGSRSRRRLRTAFRGAFDVVRLARRMRGQHIDLIHAADRPRDAALCVVLARLTGAKSIIHCNVEYADWMSRPLRWALRHADALVTVSSFVAGTLVAGGHRPDRIHVVLNVIDLDRWVPGRDRDEARREFGVLGDDPLVLSVCRLMRAKGPVQLIRACAAVRDRFPGLRLVIVGIEGPGGAEYRAEIDRTIRELGVGDMVEMAGWRTDVPRLMAAADVYAMPSTFEPFGLVFLESMAMTVPVVAIDNGGTPEVVEQGTTGLLSSPDDLDGLIDNLSQLLGNAATRRRMGLAGRQRVVEQFTTDRMARDIAAVYDSVAPPRRAESRSHHKCPTQ